MSRSGRGLHCVPLYLTQEFVSLECKKLLLGCCFVIFELILYKENAMDYMFFIPGT